MVFRRFQRFHTLDLHPQIDIINSTAERFKNGSHAILIALKMLSRVYCILVCRYLQNIIKEGASPSPLINWFFFPGELCYEMRPHVCVCERSYLYMCIKAIQKSSQSELKPEHLASRTQAIITTSPMCYVSVENWIDPQFKDTFLAYVVLEIRSFTMTRSVFFLTRSGDLFKFQIWSLSYLLHPPDKKEKIFRRHLFAVKSKFTPSSNRHSYFCLLKEFEIVTFFFYIQFHIFAMAFTNFWTHCLSQILRDAF